MRGKLILASLVAVSLLVLGLTVQGEIVGYIPSYSSTSPLNPAVYGSSIFFVEASARYRVVTVDTPLDALSIPGRIVYVVLGPDRAFSPSEVEALEKLAEEGRLGLLVADETMISNYIVKELLNVTIEGRLLTNPDADDDWIFVFPVDCGDLGSGLVSRASRISSMGDGAKPLCVARGVYKVEHRSVENPVIGVYYEDGGFKAVVVSDSSICANFMTKSTLWNPEGNLGLCMRLLEKVAGPGGATIVFDVGHYSESRIAPMAGVIALSILGLPGKAASSMHSKAGPLLFTAILLSLALILSRAPFTVYEPPRRDDGLGLWRGMLARIVKDIAESSGDPLLRASLRRGRISPSTLLRAYRLLESGKVARRPS